MPFGLKNAAQTFRRLMDSICQPFDFVFVYLNDILVASSTQAEHKNHLQLLFQRLADFGLVVNMDKCQFGRCPIEFLGHLIDKYGARPIPSKVEAVQAFPYPTTLQDLQRFASMINFYYRFIPLAATIMAPIYQTIENKPKLLFWNKTLKTAFQNAKCALAGAAMLHHSKHHAPLTLSVDASHIGGVLQQIVDGQLQPLAFFSRKLGKPETKYSAFDRESLVMHLNVRHFRYFLEGRHFVIFTDHKPLTFAFSKVSDAWSARQQRQLSAISEFTTDVRHIAGKANLVADTLFRASLSMVVSSPPDLDFVAMAQTQQIAKIQAYRTAITGLQLEDFPVGPDKVCLLCDVSLGLSRPVVPPSWRRKVFDIIHGLSYPFIRTTRQLMRQKYAWHGLHKDVGLWSKQCVNCQSANPYQSASSDIPTSSPTFRPCLH